MGSAIEFPVMGCGTWAWGNQVLWGYDPSMDGDLQAVFDRMVAGGVTFFDTGDSYGTGKFKGQSEKLLKQFSQSYSGANADRIFFGNEVGSLSLARDGGVDRDGG